MATPKPNDSDERPTTIRMPNSLHERIGRLAKAKRRSFNAQSVIVLEIGIDDAEQEDARK